MAYGTVSVWDGSRNTLFVVLPASGMAEASGKASLQFWFFPDSMGSGVVVGSAVAVTRALMLGGDDVGSS